MYIVCSLFAEVLLLVPIQFLGNTRASCCLWWIINVNTNLSHEVWGTCYFLSKIFIWKLVFAKSPLPKLGPNAYVLWWQVPFMSLIVFFCFHSLCSVSIWVKFIYSPEAHRLCHVEKINQRFHSGIVELLATEHLSLCVSSSSWHINRILNIHLGPKTFEKKRRTRNIKKKQQKQIQIN